MSPHLVWWQLVLIVGFAICAASLAIGADGYPWRICGVCM
jgi:hypothetical protein